MDHLCLKEEEKPSKSDALQLNAEGKSHTFQFCMKSGRINKVVCDTSKTVFGALNENVEFNRYNKEGKEIIIRRSKGQNHEAAVKTDFPCCLIEEDETLQINFYKVEKCASTNQETTTDTDPQSLVTFYIRTRGMTRKKIMKSSVFSDNTIDYVCVFAHKGDTFKKALQRDGRFLDDIFDKACKLVDDEKKDNQLNLKVDFSDGKKFELMLNAKRKKSQAPASSDKTEQNPIQEKNKTEQKTIQEKKTKVTDPSTEGHATQNTSGNSSGDSGNSFLTDIKNILQTLCKDVLDQLNQQENPQVQEFLQKEYDKGVVECFTEVNKVRRIIELSDSVCVIRVDDSPKGTGFLFFDRFILTNAHVVKEFVYSPQEAPHTLKLSGTLTAVFNYEVFGSAKKNLQEKSDLIACEILQVKSDLIAYRYEKDDEHRWHDFALLELEAKPDNCTELLKCCKHVPFPISGGIYIVGHPGNEVKKMDPCFIIGIEDRKQSIKKHISENPSCPFVSLQSWPYLYKNQITYNTCLFHGSSGSPVFDAQCRLIGMHTGGFDYKEGGRTRSFIEFSSSMQPILESIITQVNRSDILELLSKFPYIQEISNLRKMDVHRTHMPNKEEKHNEDEKMDTD